MFQLEHRSGFYRNTVENSEISENHLKAIVWRLQVVGREGFMGGVEIVAGKTQGEEKAWKKGERSWQSVASSANWHGLGESRRGGCPSSSPPGDIGGASLPARDAGIEFLLALAFLDCSVHNVPRYPGPSILRLGGRHG